MPSESIGLCSSAHFNNQILSTATPTALAYLMRITDLPERIGEGEDQYDLRPEVLEDLERIKWNLARQRVSSVERAAQPRKTRAGDLNKSGVQNTVTNGLFLLLSVASFACTPQDIADVIVFLCVGTSMINGQTVVVDGGLSL